MWKYKSAEKAFHLARNLDKIEEYATMSERNTQQRCNKHINNPAMWLTLKIKQTKDT